MSPFERVSNIGIKVTTTKTMMTHEGVEKIAEGLKKVEDIGEVPQLTLGMSLSENLIRYLKVQTLGGD